jgi:hypothetical protein
MNEAPGASSRKASQLSVDEGEEVAEVTMKAVHGDSL